MTPPVLRVVEPDLVESIAAFMLLSDDDGTPLAVECCACGQRYRFDNTDETDDAMRHVCMLTHDCKDHCPNCSKTRRSTR